jgi:hypothetical protein
VTLHGILKAGKSSPPEGSADPPDGPAGAAACRTPETARQLRGLLEGLGIDPGALEVRIGIRKPGEPGRPCGGEAADPDAAGAGWKTDQQASGGLDLTLSSRGEVRGFCSRKRTTNDRNGGSNSNPQEKCLQRSKQISGQEHGARAQEGQRLDGAPRARHTRWGGQR